MVASIASDLPDPARPFWWFSSTPWPHRKLSAGALVYETAAARLPAEADYWCHEGATEWQKVNREVRPKPAPQKRKAIKRKAKLEH